MRVLHVISSLNPRHGGPVTAVVGMASAQKADGLDVSVLASWRVPEEFETAKTLEQRGVRVDMVGPCHGPLVRHRDLAALCRDRVGMADVVHTHTMWEEIQHQAAQASRDIDKPLVITPHGMLDQWSLKRARWKKRVSLWWRVGADLRGADAIHFTTEPERRSAAKCAGHKPAIVEPLGVDLSEFENLPPLGTFRRQHPEIGERPIIVFLGRIHGGKGLEYLIPATAQLANPRAMLVVVGPDGAGDFRQEVDAMVQRLGLKDRVLFTDMLQGVKRIEALVDADLFALPSHHENFGLAVIEALAAGTPVVISDKVNIHEEIVAAGVGTAVPCDVGLVTAELNRWLGDEELRRNAAAKARDFVWQRYDWRQIARNWREHYTRVVHAHGQQVVV